MYSKKLKGILLLILVLAAQMAFGQSKGMVIYQSNGNIIALAVSEIDSIIFNACVDIDSNAYPIVKIGNQWWTVENLKVTHYRDGTAIPLVTDNSAWYGLSTGAYCAYNNDASNESDTYGYLYNWYAVNGNGGTYNLAPSGWHVPSDAEWQTLVDYLGGGAVAGGKLKEAGTAHWKSPNTGATNESGFTALPWGDRNILSDFVDVGSGADFWSSTELGSSGAWYRELGFDHASVYRNYCSKPRGFSVRLVRDHD
jgi:uncharacterized protein (TIGR02145 family)